VSERNNAIDVLIEMLDAEDGRDRVNAAGKLLNADGMTRAVIDKALIALKEVMNDESQRGGDRVNAASKLKDFEMPREKTVRDRQKMIAAMTNAELDEIIKNHIQFDPMLD
jgi:hypothetical protein